MPYRAEDTVLQQRLEALEEELRGLRARAEQLGDVCADEQRTIAELDKVRRRLGANVQLPMLGNVRVASPCKASWDEMTGDEQVRFCGGCAKNVYNLSAMSREAAESLLVEKEGKLCVRFYQRADGTVMTADCPVGVRKKRVRRVAGAAVGAGLLAAAGSAMMDRATMGISQQHATMGEPAMGVMVADPPHAEPQPPLPPPPPASPVRPQSLRSSR